MAVCRYPCDPDRILKLALWRVCAAALRTLIAPGMRGTPSKHYLSAAQAPLQGLA